MSTKPFNFQFSLEYPVVAIVMICLLSLAFILYGVTRHREGKESLQKEAVSNGYAEYYVENGEQRFRWLCDVPAE